MTLSCRDAVVKRLSEVSAIFHRSIATIHTNGLADAGAVSGAEAGARVLARIAEGSHASRAVAVALAEVVGQAAQNFTEHFGGQAVAAHRGADQEAVQAEDVVQVLAVHRGQPADPLGEGGGGEADGT